MENRRKTRKLIQELTKATGKGNYFTSNKAISKILTKSQKKLKSLSSKRKEKKIKTFKRKHTIKENKKKGSSPGKLVQNLVKERMKILKENKVLHNVFSQKKSKKKLKK